MRGADHAIRIVNDTVYGLAAGVWSMDTQRALNVACLLGADTGQRLARDCSAA